MYDTVAAILRLRLLHYCFCEQSLSGRIHSIMNVEQVLNCECLTGKIHSIISVQEATSVILLIMLLNVADNNNPDFACSTVFIMGEEGWLARRRRRRWCGHRRVHFWEQRHRRPAFTGWDAAKTTLREWRVICQRALFRPLLHSTGKHQLSLSSTDSSNRWVPSLSRPCCFATCLTTTVHSLMQVESTISCSSLTYRDNDAREQIKSRRNWQILQQSMQTYITDLRSLHHIWCCR